MGRILYEIVYGVPYMIVKVLSGDMSRKRFIRGIIIFESRPNNDILDNPRSLIDWDRD